MPVMHIAPWPKQSQRYQSEMLSDPLPRSLFKVLRAHYASRLVDLGEMQWSTLTWFQHLEDPDRGDPLEGSRRYFPFSRTLDLTRTGTVAGAADNTSFTLPDHGVQSRAARSDHIFIYSMTLDSALRMDPSQSDEVCVEIFDPPLLVQRVQEILTAGRRFPRSNTLIHAPVNYWSEEDRLKEVWALPHRLVMHKHRRHKDQREYRLAFGTCADVFDFHNVEIVITPDGPPPPRRDLAARRHRMKLRLGTLRDCCRIV